MRLVSFLHEGSSRWGVLDGERILAAPVTSPSLKEALRDQGKTALDAAAEALKASEVVPAPPIPDAEKVICVGLNYLDHVIETGREKPTHPVIFTRFADSLVGDGAPLLAPPESETFDFEGELAIVIGVAGRRIPVERALDHVLGYSIINDGSIREFQHQTHQFTPGKNFEASGGFGPVIVTPDELGDLSDRGIRTTLNGKVVQESDLGQLVFGVPELISRISAWTTLRPGDVIATGTPGGVGAAREPKLWMRPGDRVEVEIDGIGTLSNPIAADGDRPIAA